MSRARIARRLAVLAVLATAAWAPGWAGDLALFLALGLVPGLVVAERLAVAGAATRTALALALGPLVSAVLAWGLVAAGLGLAAAAWTVAALAGAAWLLPAAAPRPVRGTETGDPPLAAPAWWLAVVLAAAVAVPPLVNAYVLVRGDTWTHAGIVMTIHERGVPPEDPRFAGIALHYPWFYNFLLAVLGAVRGRPPFPFMAIWNVATAFATVALVAALAQRLWRRGDAAWGAAALVVIGVNAGAWLLWPLRLVKTLTGETRGLAEVARLLEGIEFGTARIIYSLSAPYALMVSTLDKLLVGSPLAYGYLLMVLHAWAVIEWLERGARRALAVIAAAAAGMMLFHGVVGLSVNPVWIGTLALAAALALRWRWLGAPARLALAGAATLAGALAATPYMRSVASGWEPSQSGLRHSYLAPDWVVPWTLLTAGAFAWWFAARPWRDAWRARRPVHAVVALYLAAMVAFACVVRLPERNEVKFVWQVFVPAAVLAGPGFATWLAGIWRRRNPLALGGLALVFLVPPALTLHGYVVDPEAHTHPSVAERPGEGDLYRWLHQRTPADAIVVDRGFRDLAMVKARRALYLGTEFGPERAAFPLDQVTERRRVTADLYGAAQALDADIAALARFGRPMYLVFRPEDDSLTAGARAAIAARRDRFELVYARDGYRVLRMRTGGSAG